MTISNPIETDLGGVWVLEDSDGNLVAEVDVTKRQDGQRDVVYKRGSVRVDGVVPADDPRTNDELVRDVLLLRGKTTKPVFRRRS